MAKHYLVRVYWLDVEEPTEYQYWSEKGFFGLVRQLAVDAGIEEIDILVNGERVA